MTQRGEAGEPGSAGAEVEQGAEESAPTGAEAAAVVAEIRKRRIRRESAPEKGGEARIPEGHSPPVPDSATTSLLLQALSAGRPQSQKFGMVIIPEDGWPTCEEFGTAEALVARIRELLGQSCFLFPFLGTRLGITEGVNRFLTTPFGAIPLFEIPDPTETPEVATGWVGEEPLEEFVGALAPADGESPAIVSSEASLDAPVEESAFQEDDSTDSEAPAVLEGDGTPVFEDG